ncbi:MAG TPA: DnaJ domain-containing protein [candidate division Zixibacteria bacterium]|nr:DnaJ domain-containing protein [candidate division Zixibacteria bacterium]
MIENDLYRILQVAPDCDPEVIEAAYRALRAKLDPAHDVTGVHEVRQKELDRAYRILGDPGQRRAYDGRRAAGMVAVGPGPDEPGAVSVTLSDRLAASAIDRQEAGHMTIDFGRYAGWRLADLVQVDPDYLRWLSRHSSGIRYRGAILRLLADRDEHRTRLRVPSER